MLRAKKRTTKVRGAANFGYAAQDWQNEGLTKSNAGFALAHGSMSSSQSGEGEIRRSLIEANHDNGIVASDISYSGEGDACL